MWNLGLSVYAVDDDQCSRRAPSFHYENATSSERRDVYEERQIVEGDMTQLQGATKVACEVKIDVKKLKMRLEVSRSRKVRSCNNWTMRGRFMNKIESNQKVGMIIGAQDGFAKVNAAGLEGFHGIAFSAKMWAQNVKKNLDLGHPCDFCHRVFAVHETC